MATPIRNIRVDDDLWGRAGLAAESRGSDLSSEIRRFLETLAASYQSPRDKAIARVNEIHARRPGTSASIAAYSAWSEELIAARKVEESFMSVDELAARRAREFEGTVDFAIRNEWFRELLFTDDELDESGERLAAMRAEVTRRLAAAEAE
jgi:hypothetical protein